MQLDVSMLDKLVHEYCIYRGLVGGHISDVLISSNCSRSHQRHPVESASGDSLPPNIDCGTGRLSDSETSVNNVIDMEVAHSACHANMQGNENEVRFLHEVTNNSEDCSTSNVNQTTSCRRWRRLRSHGAGQHSRHKRWKGRTERIGFTPDVPLKENNKGNMHANRATDGATLEDDQASLDHSSVEHVDDKENKYETVLGLRELASKGMAAEVVEEINTIDPDFFKQNPVLLFHLKQVEFLKHVGDGDHGKALKIACSYLGPLAATNSELIKPLKEALFTLLKPNDEMAKSIPLPALATSLQIALGRRLGIEEPQLMKIMRETLHSHNEWFRLQMCKDHFEGLLKIDCLKDVNATLFIDSTSRTVMDNCAHGPQFSVSSNNRLPEDGSSPASVSSGDVICNENAILKVMEFLALPRADAIHLLVQYNGNAETVIQQIFA
ncbi:hypothetical protein Taro_003792 [Colocasia esculenta]|uniref:CTLH domain-containing protein n=1 Tax=Colocasia esculenta TaxID=4460 RepID=A0A843TKQ6_COLES|nr:hypothetical protein [Colocasia esculenta]